VAGELQCRRDTEGEQARQPDDELRGPDSLRATGEDDDEGGERGRRD
jgi:hypothetical protein